MRIWVCVAVAAGVGLAWAGPPGTSGKLALPVQGAKSKDCPSGKIQDILNTLLNDPALKAEVDAAWAQSNPGQNPLEEDEFDFLNDESVPATKANEEKRKRLEQKAREQAGWVLQCRSGAGPDHDYHTEIRRLAPGHGYGVTMNPQPSVQGSDCRIVSMFHTHPGDKHGAHAINDKTSLADVLSTDHVGVPGTIFYGPANGPLKNIPYGFTKTRGSEIASAKNHDHKEEVLDDDGNVIETHYFFTMDEASNTGKAVNANKRSKFKECVFGDPSLDPSMSATGECLSGPPTAASATMRNPTDEEVRYAASAEGEARVVFINQEGVIPAGGSVDLQAFGICGEACGCKKATVTNDINVTFTGSKSSSTEQASLNTSCPPIDCSWSWTDPHLYTQDGLRFSFQSAGEFVFAKDPESGFEVQVRQYPAGRSRVASINSASAVGYKGDRVAVYSGTSDRPLELKINGESVELDEARWRTLASGAEVQLKDSTVSVRSPEGHVAQSFANEVLVNVGVHLEGSSRGLGLVGSTKDADGTHALFTRDGSALSAPVAFEDLYGPFMDSWRVDDTESLFDYEPGQSARSFVIEPFPEGPARLADFDAAQLERARAACLSAGVEHPLDLRDCILDVLVMEDESVARLVVIPGQSGELLHIAYEDDEKAAQTEVTLTHPRKTRAGAMEIIRWTGPNREGELVVVAKPDAPATKWESYVLAEMGSSIAMRLPAEPGEYEVRYIDQQRKVRARSKLTLEVGPVQLVVPKEVLAGAALDVSWTAPQAKGDYVMVARRSLEANRPNNSWAYTDEAESATLRAPDDPGLYEVQYVAMKTKKVLARAPFRVIEATATLVAPKSAPAGGPIPVLWIGPDNHRDYVTVVPPGSNDSTFTRYQYTSVGNRLTIGAPDDPGVYELRYVTGQQSRVLARRKIVIEPTPVKLALPKSAVAGSSVEIAWTGPGHARDYITIVPKGSPDTTYKFYAYTYNAKPTVEVGTPEEPGEYEARYVTGYKGRVLARQPITLTQKESP